MNANGDALCFVGSLSEDTNTFGMLQKKTYIPFTLVLQKAHIALNLRTIVMWWWWGGEGKQWKCGGGSGGGGGGGNQ